MTTAHLTDAALRSQRRSAFVRGVALTAGLGVTLALAQTVGVPLVLNGSGSRIPNATLQAYNTAGGIAAVLGNTRSGTSDAAVVLSQAGTGQFLKQEFPPLSQSRVRRHGGVVVQAAPRSGRTILCVVRLGAEPLATFIAAAPDGRGAPHEEPPPHTRPSSLEPEWFDSGSVPA